VEPAVDPPAAAPSGPGPTPRATIKRIIAEEAARAGVDPGDITGRRRTRKILGARHAAMRRVHETYPHKSSTELARLFNRDHTTVLYVLGRLARGRA